MTIYKISFDIKLNNRWITGWGTRNVASKSGALDAARKLERAELRIKYPKTDDIDSEMVCAEKIRVISIAPVADDVLV